MGFSFGKKKDSVSNQEAINTNEQNEEIIEKKHEEDTKNMKGKQKKEKRIYLALDMEGKAVIDEKNEIVISSATEDGKAIEWPSRINRFSKKVKSDKKYSVVISQKSKDDRQKVRAEAKKELYRMACEDNLINNNSGVEEVANEKKCEVDVTNEEEIRAIDSTLNKETRVESGTGDSCSIPEKEMKKEENSQVIKMILDVEDRLNRDLNELIDGLSDTIGKNGNEIFDATKKEFLYCKKDIIESAQKISKDAVNYLLTKVMENVQTNAHTNTKLIVKEVKGQEHILHDNQEKLTKKLTRIEKSVDEWKEYDEAVLGKLNKVDELKQVLSDKGVTISKEIPPINAHEEDIINLVKYSQKITEQLGFAARELVRKREAYENQKQGDENEQQIFEQKIKEAKEDGEKQGKLAVIKELLNVFDGIDGIKDSDNDYLKAIWNKLKELGVEIDGDGYYSKGEVIELSKEDLEKMIATYPGLDEEVGKYKIKKTGLVFMNEIIVKAEFEKNSFDELNSEDNILSINKETTESLEDNSSKEDEESQSKEQESETVSEETEKHEYAEE